MLVIFVNKYALLYCTCSKCHLASSGIYNNAYLLTKITSTSRKFPKSDLTLDLNVTYLVTVRLYAQVVRVYNIVVVTPMLGQDLLHINSSKQVINTDKWVTFITA